MADVRLNHIYKVYDGGVKAVSDFNIDIKDKEFIVFVGPSGCGKSTTLRMIAGLEDITAGDLFIQDQLVNDVQPKDRDIAMVFQNYALYPHMTVYENMAFSLRNRHMPKEEINRRVLEAARILDIEDFLQRKPKAMSGGQRQRVSLGRAIVRQPKVFLLDEPLSNLDAKLRAQMRTEISKLHKRLQTTFIYVTHDQVEAMTMGTRIVVMKLGFVQQIDTPTNLYNHPINKFVAGFIGTPQMNFFDVTLLREHDKVSITFDDKQQTVMGMYNFYKCNPSYLDGQTHLTLGVRPDGLLITDMSDSNGVELVISEIEALGNETLLYCDLAHQLVKDDKVGKSSVIVKVSPDNSYVSGQHIKVVLADYKIHLFDNETEMTVMPFIPKTTYQTISFKGNTYTIFGKTYTRFDAWKDIPDGDDYKVEIPHSAIVPGKGFTLKVVAVEDLEDNKHLVILHNPANDTYITVNSDEKPEVGSDFSFGLKYADLILDPKLNCKPVTHETSLIGNFEKIKEIDTKDYNLVAAEKAHALERGKAEKEISKFYLTSEEFGADADIHNAVKASLEEKAKDVQTQETLSDLLSKREKVLEEVVALQKSKDFSEDLYINNKNELLSISKRISSLIQNALTATLKEVKANNTSFATLSSEDLAKTVVQQNKIVDLFISDAGEVANKAQGVSLDVEKQKLVVALDKLFRTSRLYTEDFVVDYFKQKLADYKNRDEYKNVALPENSEIFANGNETIDNKRLVSLFKETVSCYHLALSALSTYVRGLYLGNNTRWHKQASDNADETFDLYNKYHDMYINDFRLCDEVKTKDFKLKKVANFYICLGGVKFKLKDELISRLNNIEGPRLLKNKYRFVIKPLVENYGQSKVKSIQEHVLDDAAAKDATFKQDSVTTRLPDKDFVAEHHNDDTVEIRRVTSVNEPVKVPHNQDMNIQHEILGIRNYDVHTFATVKMGDMVSDIEITGLDKADDYYISADLSGGFGIYTLDTEIRIA